jgi:Zn-dependent oligopeptidase
VSPDKAARDASLAAADHISAWAVDASLREDVYAALKAFNATPEARALTGECRRYLDFTMRDSRRSGLELPKAKRDELAALLKRSSKLGLEFSNCLDADTTALTFTPAELNGTTEVWRGGRKRDPKDSRKLVVTVKYPDFRPVMEDVTVEATRKKLEFAYNTVCAKDNTARLDELIKLRADVAKLLGYTNWAAYVAEVNMAKNPGRIASFLGELGARLRPPRDDQIGVLLSLKRADKAAAREPFDARVRSWESSYYMNAVERRDFAVDQQVCLRGGEVGCFVGRLILSLYTL